MQFEGQLNPLRDADRLHKFRREFRALSETNHPHLVGMQMLEYDDQEELWFFTMELVEGTDFLSHVRPDGKLKENRLRHALPQLVSGISALHARHIVHRDLKPSNVMVDHNGRVVILDFGLVVELQRRLGETISQSSGQFAGTLRYAAPEQLSGQRQAAVDWYAVGVMVYEALTGQPPFDGTTADLIVQKQTLEAPKLTGRPDLPDDLSSIVDQLLSRDPDERPVGSAIASTLSSVIPLSTTESEDLTALPNTEEPNIPLVGRETQLAQLDAARAQWLDQRRPTTVLVSGLSGEGKTTLIDKFLQPLRQEGKTLVLSGRCYDRESVPYKAIDGLIDALSGWLMRRTRDDVANWLPEDIGMLAQLFPVMRRVKEIAELDLTLIQRLDPKQTRQRAFGALKQLLVRICDSTPLVMFIDDLQWGDADSADALMALMSQPNPPAVLLLAGFRRDEAAESGVLDTVAASQWAG